MVARRVRNWPGSKAKRSRSPSGMAKVIATAPAASGLTRLMASSWKRGADMASGLRLLIGFEIVEGLLAVEALVQRLAGRGPELGGDDGVGGAALWTGDRLGGLPAHELQHADLAGAAAAGAVRRSDAVG